MASMASVPLTLAVLPNRVRPDGATALARLCARLSVMLGRPVTGLRAGSYDAILSALVCEHAQLAWLSPLLASLAEDRVSLRPLLVARRGDRVAYRAVMVVDGESPARTADDLRGATVAWVDGASGSGYLIPRMSLAAAGHDPSRFFREELFCGSHDRVVRAVLDRRVQVGATFAGEDARPVDEPLRVVVRSEPIPNDLIVAHGHLPLSDAMEFAAALQALTANDEGRALLAGVFDAHAFEFTDRTHLRQLRAQLQVARRRGLFFRL
jgi:phosphonate transport system substrate-binding protein